MPEPLEVQMVARRLIIPRRVWEGIVDLGIKTYRQPLELAGEFITAGFDDAWINESISADTSKGGRHRRPS